MTEFKFVPVLQTPDTEVVDHALGRRLNDEGMPVRTTGDYVIAVDDMLNRYDKHLHPNVKVSKDG